MRGTRPSRAAAAKESAVVSGRPKMPKHLSPVARDKWKELVRDLSARGTLTKADASALELYCETYAQWRACLEEVLKYGVMVETTVTDSSGESFTKRVQNPAQKLAIQLQNSLRQMLKELGFTPASREKAKPAKPAKPKNTAPKPGTAAWYAEQAEEPEAPAEEPSGPQAEPLDDMEDVDAALAALDHPEEECGPNK